MSRPASHRAFRARLRIALPSNKAAVSAAVDEVLGVADRCGCLRERLADLEIALREALANAIIHGNALHGGKRVFLRCYGAPRETLMILVRDEGAGFDPDDVPDPRRADRIHLDHGRGLLLMRELMDHVEYRKGGREVLLVKRCD